jgi:hypothetical protein
MSQEQSDSMSGAHLRRTLIAVGLAWCLPGLGHVMLGRVRRGLLFAVLILGGYALGLAHDGRLALRDERQPFLTALQIVANLGVGPLDFIARKSVYGELVYSLPKGIRSGVEDQHTRVFRDRTRSSLSIYGTAYLWTAGLMNLLLLFDVWDIGKGRRP